MAYQDFSSAVMGLIRAAMSEVFADDQALKDHINRGGVDKRDFLVALAQSKLDLVQAKIDNIDTIVAGLKVQMLAELNAKKSVLLEAKTNFENLDV